MSDDPEFIENTTYDALQIGQSARLTRKLGPDDIAAFALVSGDVNPAHVDPEYAEHTPFHGVIGHGMWEAALISRLLGTCLPGPGTIYLAQTLQFLRPVRIGDELRITATVTSKNPANRHVQLDCEVKNQTGTSVLTGVATVIAPEAKIRRPRARVPLLHLPFAQPPYASLLAAVAQLEPLRCAVIHPCDAPSLRVALDVAQRRLITPLLIGPQARLRALGASLGLSLDDVVLIDAPHSHAAAARGAAMAAAGKVEMLMAGAAHLDELIEAVLALPALHTKRRLSHICHLELPMYDKPLLISDGVLNVRPTLADKIDIVQNAIELAHALGNAEPRVALLCALNTVTSEIASTLDAAALCKMRDRGQITGALVDGPLTVDATISPFAARASGAASAVGLHADILITPDLEAGSMLTRTLQCLGGAENCGVIMGAAVPIALSNGSDNAPAPCGSAALALLLAHRYRTRRP
ncbi:bifunctional enoyl-CoA hydratase/phosphate acetyltransferase [Janthinobacterium sp. J1-1]|uniref:bifunctional enoyl-CoA hydratase/phosphate acetyltransferase n=1 Tax=Janthinobacterium sp. J1-1 TaxID=3065910 RepID=UPI0028119F02|nr:bifunctional enoyl-CoA hydratase/phosphate acetyltransferase [Janthinobacterium sp. J1-1]